MLTGDWPTLTTPIGVVLDVLLELVGVPVLYTVDTLALFFSLCLILSFVERCDVHPFCFRHCFHRSWMNYGTWMDVSSSLLRTMDT